LRDKQRANRPVPAVAPGLMVLAIILFTGEVSGAHLNPAVSIAFALRRIPVANVGQTGRRAAE
jgi:glycerol uptake facilitator-like aquaporin